MGKGLILIENRYEINYFSDYFKEENFSKKYIVLAIFPSAQVALTELGIPFIKSNYLFEKKDHIEISKKSKNIIKLMREHFFLEDNVGVKHAYETEFFSFFRHYYLHYCLSTLLILDNATNKFKLDLIICSYSVEPKDINKYLTHSSSMMGYIAQQYATKNNLKIIVEGENKREVTEQDDQNILIRKLVFETQLFLYKYLSKDKNIIWATHSAYNIPRVANYLRYKINDALLVGGLLDKKSKLLSLFIDRKFYKFYKFPPPTSKKEVSFFIRSYFETTKIISDIIKRKKNVFSFKNVEMHDLFMDYINNGLKNQIKETFNGSKAFSRIVSLKKPSFLISNQAASYHYAIGEICKKENIKGLLISHGSHVPQVCSEITYEINEHSRYMVNTHYPFVSAQTTWTKRFLEEQKDLVSKPIDTGPLLFSKQDFNVNYSDLRKNTFQQHHKKKIILHAATPFGWNYFHPLINLTLDEYVDHINDLIQSVDEMSEVFLAVRIRMKSFHGMSMEQIKSLFIKSECYAIYTEGSFEDYLLISDLLVSFSSTTIEEALQNKIPVLQYDPFNRYSHIPAEKIKTDGFSISPIYYISNQKDLYWGIDWIVKHHLEAIDSVKQLDWSPHILEKNEDWLEDINNEY